VYTKLFYGSIILGLIIYLVILGYIYIFQRNLLYHPSVNGYMDDAIQFKYSEIKIPTQDGIEIKGWLHEKDLVNKKTILFFHGNAGELSNRNYKLNEFSKMDINFLIIAWRGFSGNEGKPTEKGLYQDASSAIDWLKSKGVREEKLILYGESLGTGIATEVAQNKKLAGVILESPYTSMTELAGRYYPLLPVRLLLKDRYESIKKIKNIHSPILIMHGGLDLIVPFQMGAKLYEAANEPKFKYFITNDDHMMRYDQALIAQIKNFINFK
jgi:fermentation-respiration switch protein FrsA (DUF1100 family)